MIAPRQSKLIAIVGGSGAGKSWLVDRFCQLLGDKACHLQLDDFYRDRSHLSPARRARINFDLPEAIDWQRTQQTLLACLAGSPTQLPRYDFATHCRVMECAWAPRPIVFVDGLWLLRRPELRRLFSLSIYVDAAPTLRRSRRLARDTAERGASRAEIIRRFSREVIPMHARYVEPQKKWADLVLRQPLDETQVFELANRLWSLVEQAAPMPAWMRETFRAELAEQLLPLPHEPSR